MSALQRWGLAISLAMLFSLLENLQKQEDIARLIQLLFFIAAMCLFVVPSRAKRQQASSEKEQ